MLSQIELSDNGIGTAVVTENRCNGFIKSPTEEGGMHVPTDEICIIRV